MNFNALNHFFSLFAFNSVCFQICQLGKSNVIRNTCTADTAKNLKYTHTHLKVHNYMSIYVYTNTYDNISKISVIIKLLPMSLIFV